MKTILIAQYIAKRNDGHFLDDVIAFYTGLFPINWGTPPHSHSEICFLERNVCWSSTNRDDFTGTRFEISEKVFTNPDRWDFFKIELSNEQEECLYLFCKFHIGKKYDFLGIFGFAVFGINNINKFYCSEGVGFGLAIILILKFHRILSPRHLTKCLLKKGYKLESYNEVFS